MRLTRRSFSAMASAVPCAGLLGAALRDQWVRESVLAPAAAAPGFRKIGPLATNLWIFNTLNVEEADGDVFYITTFNSSDRGQLIRLDYRRNAAKVWTIPAGIGSWGIIRARDGNIYLGSYNGGSLMCFDPRQEKWIARPQMSEDYRAKEFIICDLAQAPNNDIYYGTYPGCRLVRCDLDREVLEDVGSPAPEENYLRIVRTTPAGIVLCGIATQKARTVAYLPRKRAFQTLTPEEFQQAGFASPVVTRNYIAEALAGKFITYNSETLNISRIYDFPEGAGNCMPYEEDKLLCQQGREALFTFDLRDGKRTEVRRQELPSANGRLYLTKSKDPFYLRVQSYTCLKSRDRKYQWQRIPVDGLGQNIFWLNTFPDGRIFGGPELGQTMFAWDPRTRKLLSYDQVIDAGGEIYYAIPFRNRLYTISYVKATLAVFDPAKPWDQGSRPDSNPRTILEIPDEQYRPVGGIHLGPGGKMYIGTQPDYGMLGGALSVFDPQTGKIEVYRNIVPDQQITAVATDDKWVYAVANPGGGGGAKPRAAAGCFLAWDPAAKKVVFEQPFAPGEGIGALACVNGCVYFSLGRRFCEYDHRTRALRTIHEFEKPRRVPNQSLKATKDGTLWAILDGELAHILPRENRIETIQETAGKAHGGLTIGLDGTVYFGAGTDIWMHRPARASAPFDYSSGLV